LQVGQASPLRLIFLAGDALLSPLKLASPHGHGGQVVVGATVGAVGLGVNWTGGELVTGGTVATGTHAHLSPPGALITPASYQWMNPAGHVQHGSAVVGHGLQVGHTILTPLAGEALLSPDKLTSDPHGHGGQVVVGATVVVGLGVS